MELRYHYTYKDQITCGYRSSSISRNAVDGCGVFSSLPTHISYNKCPKQIISILSISLIERDHITALTRELKPNKPFSKPESLKKKEDGVKSIARISINPLCAYYGNAADNAKVITSNYLATPFCKITLPLWR